MTMSKSRFAAMTAAMLASLAGMNPALAGGPESMDRVPGNAAVVISLRDMEGFVKEFEALEKAMGLPADVENPIAQAQALLGTKGLNSHGSMSVAIMPEADGSMDFEAAEPNGVMIIPVSNYADFVKGLGAAATEGVQSIRFDEKEAFVKDIGGGYAAISNAKATVEGFGDKAAQGAGRSKAMGATGAMIADRSDMVVYVNMPAFKDKMKEGLAEGKAGMAEGPAAMGGEGVAKGLDQMFGFMDRFVDQSQAAVIGVDINEKGVTLDLGAQFVEGSEMAGYFAQAGNSGSLLNFLPNQAFLFAGAFDTSSEGVRRALKGFSDFSKQMQAAAQQMAAASGAPDTGDVMNLLSLTGDVEAVDASAFCLGASPSGIMGGIFTNTSTYVKPKDTAKFRGGAQKLVEGMNGKTVAGMSYKSVYTPSAATIRGVEVDSWSATMEPAADDPNGMQMQMVMNVIFGAGGMGGMSATVGDAVVSTMSQNTQLMTAAITAAKEGNGLGSDSTMKAVQANLPKDRIFEVYIGTKSLMDAAAGLMDMAGGEVSFTAPAKVSPIAMAGTAGGGGMSMHLFVPADVIKAISDIKAQMDAVEGGDGEPAGDGAQPAGEQPAPRF